MSAAGPALVAALNDPDPTVRKVAVQSVGKLAFSEAELVDNIQTFLNHLRTVKPAAAKGNYIRTVTISATRVWSRVRR